MSLLEILFLRRKNPLGGLTFAMFHFLKFSLLQLMLVVLSLLLLSRHNCQTTQKINRQSNWTPVISGHTRLSPQLDSQSNGGAKFTPDFVLNTATTASPPNTVSKDIRKLLEDYVTYLSTMPDFQKEVGFAKTSKSRFNRDAKQSFKFSTPQTFTLMPPIATTSNSSNNDIKDVSHSSLKSVDDSELQGSASTVISPVLENSAHQLGGNYYLEMPTESGLTLNLSDEELSTFIDNVLSHAAAKDFNSNSTGTASTVAIPLNEFEENATVSLPERSSTPASVTLEKSFIFSSNKTEKTKKVNENTQVETNDTKQAAVTTELPFSRLEMFENSEEIVDTSSEDDINLVSRETDADLKEPEERFYTSDGEVVTEVSNTDDLPPYGDNKAKASGGLNETFPNKDETNSNNFSRQLNPSEDTKLLHELKQTRDLLRMQIDKVKLLENSKRDDVLESGQTTTTESPETTTIEMAASEQELKNANDTDLKNFILTTESPPVTESPTLLEKSTTVFADESVVAATATTAIDLLPIDSTTAAPNELNEAISTTTSSIILSSRNGTTGSTATAGSLTTNEKLALGNYSKASVMKETIPSSTTEAAKAPKRKVKEITATVSKLLNKPLRTTVEEDLRASTSRRENNVVWNTKPTAKVSSGQSRQFATNGANYDDDDALKGRRGANEAENSSSPITAFDLLVGENAATVFNASADGDASSETDSETMILTHVPKITIIHKILKPSGNGGRANDQQTDEEAYREALRRHKDLIKTAMSSISLVPAAFKRYKVNNKNRVNIGEIYLLPNFAGSTSKVRNSLRVVPQSSKASFDRQFIHEFDRINTAANTRKVVEQQKPIVIRQVRTNTLPKFAYSRFGNKFNTEASGYQLISAPIENEHSQRQLQHDNRAKLYVAYLNSIVTKSQNPENILKIYRPNFNHRKRFKKVRIPSGYRIKKKETPTARNDTLRGGNQVFSWLDASPILITVAQSSEQQNQTLQKLPNAQALVRASGRKPAPLSRSSLSSATTTSGQWLRKENMSSSSRGPIDKSKFKVFCTYDAHRSLSAPTNDSRGRFFDIHQLEQNAAILEQCTHLVYAFASINMNGEVLPGAPVTRADGNAARHSNDTISTSALQRIKTLKMRFPHLRLLVAVGGWSTPPQLFSLLVATSKLRDRLCQNVHRFVLNYDFDGAILAWFYPVYGSKSALESSQRSPRSTAGQTLFQLDDKQNLVKFMQALRNRFDSIPHKSLEIGLMSPPFEEQIDRGYDVPKLSNLVDHLILLTFDYYGSWDDKVHHFAPLYPPTRGLLTERDSKLNINYTLSYWLNDKQAPRDKTVLGLAFFGRSFTLENPSAAEPGAKAIGPGIAGPITNKPGLLAFNELCDLYLGHPNVKVSTEDEHHITAHLQVFDQFVGFDDELSLYLKTKYAISNHLSGVFIWSINHDDYRNRCGWGRFPLLKAINKAVEHCETSAVPCKV